MGNLISSHQADLDHHVRMMSGVIVNPGKDARVIKTSVPAGFDKVIADKQWHFIVRRLKLIQLFRSEPYLYASSREVRSCDVSSKGVWIKSYGNGLKICRYSTTKDLIKVIAPSIPFDSSIRSLSSTPISTISSGKLILDDLCFYPVATKNNMTEVVLATRDLLIDRGTTRDDAERTKQIDQCTTVLKNLQDQLTNIFSAKEQESDLRHPTSQVSTPLSLDPTDMAAASSHSSLSRDVNRPGTVSLEEVGQLYLEQQVIQRKLDKLRAEQRIGTIETIPGITHTIPVGTWHMLGHYGWVYVVPTQ